MNVFAGVVKRPVSELAKVLEDMRTAPSVRRKLYFVSPLLTALLFGVYERLGLRRLKAGLVGLGRHAPRLTAADFARQSAEQIRALGLDKLEILSGPFKGMRYGDFSYNSALIPKLLGTYEADLHGWVGEAVAAGYDAVINIGCAEGYYAVGFAYADPRVEVRGGRHLQHGTGHAVQARGAERAAGSRPRRRRAHACRAREPAAPLQAAAAVHRHRRRRTSCSTSVARHRSRRPT